jgi:two-component system CheB/CheR fusion protein
MRGRQDAASRRGARGAPMSGAEIEHAAGVRVVVVEDHPDAAESLVLLLELLGHRVSVFAEGMAAVKEAHANPPDVMLVDIGLPDIDGFEVARRVRQDPSLRHAVLVALTGYGCDDDRREASAAGFDHHLVKPVEPAAIERLVAGLEARRRGDPSIAT